MAGLFGKLPASGDFVARGLGPGTRAWLDQWLTRWLAGYAAEPDLWPPGGLRGLLDAPSGPLLVVIGPSVDRAGREFPLLACIDAPGITRDAADHWADRAAVALARAVRGEYDTTTLSAALETISLPEEGAPPLVPPILWTDYADGVPEEIVAQLFGSLSSD